MKLIKLEVYVFDFDDVGKESVAHEIQYGSAINASRVVATAVDICPWDDENILNYTGTPIDEFRKLFTKEIR